MHGTLIVIHLSAAVIGLLAGYLSLAFRKGSSLHRLAGNIFVVGMLCMSGLGAFMAVVTKPNRGNLMGGTILFYMVATGWLAGRRREQKVGAFDIAALLMVSSLGLAGMTWGFQAVRSASGVADGYPPPMYFVFGSIALLFAASDVRMLVRRGVSGARRISRHLWRMSLSLLFATASFYPGQAKLFPTAVRHSNLVYVPHILVIAMTIYWMFRVLRRKRGRRDEIVPEIPATRRGADLIPHPQPQSLL